MLSSKLKSWVESHLTRSGKKFKSKKKHKEDRIASCTSPQNSSVTAEYDKVTALPVPNSSGRSNAALVIQLQNDIALNPCWSKNSHLANSPLISWKKEHGRCFVHQTADKSPSNSNSTTSFTSASISSKATSSICTDFIRQSSSDTTESLSGNNSTLEPIYSLAHQCNLSSPESAYSTGRSVDISPSQDMALEPEKVVTGSTWRQLQVSVNETGNPSCFPFSPRPRPAIRTNPWVQARNRSSPVTDQLPRPALSNGDSSGTETSSSDNSRSSMEQDRITERYLPVVKETDILSDCESPDVCANTTPLEMMDELCHSLELLMEGEQLKVITNQVTDAYRSPRGQNWNTEMKDSDRKRWDSDADDKYSQLIRETEEILSQLENDELLLSNRSQEREQAIPKKNAPAHLCRPERNWKKKARRPNTTRRWNRGFDIFSSSDSETDYRDSCDRRNSHWRLSRSKNGHRNSRVHRSLTQYEPSHVTPHFGRQSARATHRYRRQDDSVDGLYFQSCDERPPSPAPLDPCDLYGKDRWVQACSRQKSRFQEDQPLSNKQYIDQLMAEIWPEDYVYPPSNPKGYHSASFAYRNSNKLGVSSCPGSPAGFWREADPYTQARLSSLSRNRGGSDIDDCFYRSDYDRYYSRPKRRLGKSQASRLKEESRREQQRLEAEVAILRQELLNDMPDYLTENGDVELDRLLRNNTFLLVDTPSSSDSSLRSSPDSHDDRYAMSMLTNFTCITKSQELRPL